VVKLIYRNLRASDAFNGKLIRRRPGEFDDCENCIEERAHSDLLSECAAHELGNTNFTMIVIRLSDKIVGDLLSDG
jgi:hypothetical protein